MNSSIVASIACAFALASTACETVAPVDLHYVSDASPDGEKPLSDASVSVGDGNPVGVAGFCGCDFPTGSGCCVPSGGSAAFCTDSRDGCMQSGGIFIGCQAFDPGSGSLCCWNGGTSGGSALLLASACNARAVSCTTASDCNGGACQLTTCGGVTVGACGVTPTCP